LPNCQCVRLQVSDDGPGIPDRDKARLFEPNFSTKKTGMGIGLSIVNTIITDHGGTISVEDNKPKGARFIILLPVRDPKNDRNAISDPETATTADSDRTVESEHT
ncbi:MAG: HAMP domain-containing sensor histidine kinase, partial [Desulfobacterales bacterium]